MNIQKKLLLLFAAIILVVFNYAIYAKEQIIKNGETVFLELAPVDPRSLMQGDYMRLNYDIALKLRDDFKKGKKTKNNNSYIIHKKSGYVKVKLDDSNIAKYVGEHLGGALASDEKLFKYKNLGWRVIIVPNSYFFQEGKRRIFDDAKYGVFKFKGADNYVLVALADKDMNIISSKDIK